MSTVEEKHGLWGQKDLNKLFLHILAGNLGQVLETFRVSNSSVEWDNTITIRVVARVTEIIYVKVILPHQYSRKVNASHFS